MENVHSRTNAIIFVIQFCSYASVCECTLYNEDNFKSIYPRIVGICMCRLIVDLMAWLKGNLKQAEIGPYDCQIELDYFSHRMDTTRTRSTSCLFVNSHYHPNVTIRWNELKIKINKNSFYFLSSFSNYLFL